MSCERSGFDGTATSSIDDAVAGTSVALALLGLFAAPIPAQTSTGDAAVSLDGAVLDLRIVWCSRPAVTADPEPSSHAGVTGPCQIATGSGVG